MVALERTSQLSPEVIDRRSITDEESLLELKTVRYIRFWSGRPRGWLGPEDPNKVSGFGPEDPVVGLVRKTPTSWDSTEENQQRKEGDSTGKGPKRKRGTERRSFTYITGTSIALGVHNIAFKQNNLWPIAQLEPHWIRLVIVTFLGKIFQFLCEWLNNCDLLYILKPIIRLVPHWNHHIIVTKSLEYTDW